MIGDTVGFTAENSYGLSLGDMLELRLGIRSNTALGVVDDHDNNLGDVSWIDGLLIIGINF